MECLEKRLETPIGEHTASSSALLNVKAGIQRLSRLRGNSWRERHRAGHNRENRINSVSCALGLTPIRILLSTESFGWGVLNPSPVTCIEMLLESRL